jgi:PAS domain S-box-containing protein
MWEPDVDKRELRDLWVAIAIALSMGAYHLTYTLAIARELAIAQQIHRGLFFWILGLLWLAYRRWQRASQVQRTLMNILSSISTEVVMVIDSDRRIRMINESVERLFGLKTNWLIGRKTEELYGDRRINPSNPFEIRDALDKKGFHIGEATGTTADGKTFPLEIATARLRGQQGAVVLMKDITERKRAEEATRRAKEIAETAAETKTRLLSQIEEQFQKLKEAEQMRDNLTHMIVHDLRTPLQVIMANVDLMMQFPVRPLLAEETERLDEMHSQTKRLIGMVSDILDISRIESGKFPLSKSDCDLADVVEGAIGAAVLPASGPRIERQSPQSAARVSCDGEVVKRVLINLLGNAVKFSPADGVVRVGWKKNGTHARVSVSDSGPGIAPEHHAKIFDKFGQASQSGARKGPSSGVGLAFVKLAVEAHGGHVGVESQLGQGATFWFDLPTGKTVV